MHSNNVCQGGTTCVATGQHRRLGDFFTGSIDASGCVLIAATDTVLKDPTTGADYPTLPRHLHAQIGGPSLLAGSSCSR